MKNLPVRYRVAALLLVALQISCGGDGPSEPAPVATTIVANSTVNQNGTAGTAVAAAPSVIVSDQRGDPMAGVTVTFAVTAGGGSVTGASAVTNALGVATVGSWTLGPASGTNNNTLTASTGSLTPVTFTASAAAGAAASVTRVAAGEGQTAPAGTAVPIPPSVTVRDANGNAVAGATVTFTVTSGGGSVTGGTQTTNTSGVATVGSWTLGPAVGANTLSAAVGTLTPAVFTATGTAGAPASITKTAGDNQSAPDGTAVPIAPAVTVRDAGGNPVSGVTVIFAAGTGGGTLTGGTQVTNSSGVATVGSWTLGTTGTNTLTASVTGLPAATFTATATPRVACGVRTTHTIGGTNNGELTTSDCRFDDGSFVDFYSTTVATAGAYTFTQNPANFDSFLILFGADGFPIAFNDDQIDNGVQPQPSVIKKAFIPAGSYVLGANSFSAGETGTYTLSSATTGSDVTGCDNYVSIFIARGVSTDQNLQNTDCVFNGFYSDDMGIFLRAGQTVTISMNSAGFDTSLELYNLSTGALAASNDDRDATNLNAQIVFTPTASGFFLLVPTSADLGITGAYTLIVQ